MMTVLNRVRSPADLKQLTFEELAELAIDIRKMIIEVVSKNGGHLSSNLGVVELTLALHRVFNTPRDKIIWDIGHQCYPHKIVTCRKERMFSIRKKGGLLGFPDRDESEYDVVNTGHASTSLGFASGLAIARDKQKQDFHIVAVIGDGALTGGVALEALNHIGQIKPRLIIVLNDNKMSISPNVGGISKHLNYLVSGRPYIRMKEMIQHFLRSIPGVGRSMFDIAKKVEILMRTMMVPGSLFDELGIKYIGPINGHDLKEMVKELTEAQKHDFPVLLHVVTHKGQGYSPATEDPSSFHSSAPFDIQNGKFISSGENPSYSEIFGQTVLKLIQKDQSIVALTAAMPEGTGLNRVQKECPANFFDVGIAEQYMFTFAAGLRLGGLKPIVAVYSTFMQRAMDQIVHDVMLMNIPLLVGLDRAGLVGGDGPTHQGIYDLALLGRLPGLVLMAPKDENELQHMIFSGLKMAAPVFIRYPKEPGQGVGLDPDFKEIPLGRAEILRRGSHLAILAVGPLANSARRVAERLSRENGIDAEVINIRFVRPLDKDLIQDSVKEKVGIVTVEDGIADGGFSSMIRELLLASGIGQIPLLAIGVREEIVPVASRKELLEKYHLDEAGLYRDILDFFQSIKRSHS